MKKVEVLKKPAWLLIPGLFLLILLLVMRSQPASQKQEVNAAPTVQASATPTRLPDPVEEYTRRLQAHYEAGDYLAQVEDLQKLLALQPDQAELTYRLGLLLAALQPASAGEYLSLAAKLDARYLGPASSLQEAIAAAGKTGEPAYVLVSAGRALADLEEWEMAGEAFRQATLKRPDYAEGWAYLGEARQHAGIEKEDPQAGLAELEQAWKLDPRSIAANTFLALYWQRQKNYKKALSYLEAAAEVEPANATLQTEIGNTLGEMGDLPGAQARYQKATELEPKNPVFWRILAEFSLKNQIQLREIALPAARQALMLAPGDPISLDLLGQTFLMLEDAASAERFLRRALQADPGYPPAHLHLAVYFFMQNDLEAGRQELLAVKRLAPGSAYADQAERLMDKYFP